MIMKNHADDNKLLIGCAKHDEMALKKIYARYSKVFYEIAYQRLKHEDLAEIALKQSFIEIWNTANKFNPKKENAIKWMSKIVRINARSMYSL